VPTGPEIARFMQAKYPIDAARISLVLPPHGHHASGSRRTGTPVTRR
jgi:flagellar biosynthesis/type III secretory pathway M-ring protein FliF/YscJ